MSQSVWGQRGAPGSSKSVVAPSAAPSGEVADAAAATQKPEVLCMTWNHDATVLAVGTFDGFRIYSTECIPRFAAGRSGHADPVVPSAAPPAGTSSSSSMWSETLVEVANRTIPGGVGHVAIHEQGSIILFAGASPETERIVTIWDEALSDNHNSNNNSMMFVHPGSGGGGVSIEHGDDSNTNNNNNISEDIMSIPVFHHRVVSDADIMEVCILGQMQLSAPVTSLRFHERLIVVAEPFRIHLYDTTLRHLDTLLTPNHGKRSTSYSTAGDLGLVWDNTAQTVAVASTAAREMAHGDVTVPVVRALVLGPTTGSVRCLHYFAVQRNNNNNANRGGGGSDFHRTNATPSLHHSRVTDGAPLSLSASSMTAVSGGAFGYIESKLVGPQPHTHRVQCLAISPDGAYGLSCSGKGTAIKLLDVKRAVLLRQFARGVTTSTIGCMSFSADARLAACISQSGTVHIFRMMPSSPSSSNNHPSTAQPHGGGGGGGVSNHDAHRKVTSHEGGGGGGLWGSTSSLVSSSLRFIQGITPATSAMEGLQAYLDSESAVATFNLAMINSDADGFRHSLGTPIGGGSQKAAATPSAAAAPAAQQPPFRRSDMSEALFMEDEDLLQRTLDVSEHSGFDPLFTALQFRPGIRVAGGGSGSAAQNATCHLMLACGNVTPHAFGLKSKCVQVSVTLPKAMFGHGGDWNHSNNNRAGGGERGGRWQDDDDTGHDVLPPPAVSNTSVFPKDSL